MEKIIKKIYAGPDESYRCDSVTSSKKFTPLMRLVLSMREYPKIKKFFGEYLKNNIEEIDKANEEGFTALMLASYHHNTFAVNKLLKNGANPNLQNKKTNFTPLIYVLKKDISDSSLEIVFDLLEFGADPNLFDNKGNVPLIHLFANKRGDMFRLKIFKLLLQYGANLNIFNNDGKNIFSIALINATEKEMNILLKNDIDTHILLNENINAGTNMLKVIVIHFLEENKKLKEYIKYQPGGDIMKAAEKSFYQNATKMAEENILKN